VLRADDEDFDDRGVDHEMWRCRTAFSDVDEVGKENEKEEEEEQVQEPPFKERAMNEARHLEGE
jgi:hypothetical protein